MNFKFEVNMDTLEQDLKNQNNAKLMDIALNTDKYSTSMETRGILLDESMAILKSRMSKKEYDRFIQEFD